MSEHAVAEPGPDHETPGIAVLLRYTPTWLPTAEWARWREAVIALVGTAHPNNPDVARASAGAVCEALALTESEPGTPLAQVLSDNCIAAVKAARIARGLSESAVSYGVYELQRLQRCARQLPAQAPGEPASFDNDRDQLSALRLLAADGDRRLASAAQALLDALAAIQPEPWRHPLTQSEWAYFRSRARAKGFDRWPWTWRHLRCERIRQEFSRHAPVIELLTAFRPSAERLNGLLRAPTRDVPDKVAETPKVRGSVTLSSAHPWRVRTSGGKISKSDTIETRTLPGKMSAAAVRRMRKNLVQRRASDPDHLPDELEEILTSWQPRLMDPEEWVLSRDLTHRIMRRSHIRGVEAFKKHARIVAEYVTWGRNAGLEPDEASLLTGTAIDQYIQHGLSHAKDSTRATIRADLRRIATKAAMSADAPIDAVKVSHWDLKPPYDRHEVATILRLIELVTDPRTRCQIQTAVALGLGAGLDNRDIRGMTRNHVDDRGDEGILITVPGERARRIWLRYEYEDLLRAGIARLTRNEHVLGRANMGKDTIVDLYDKIRPLDDTEKVRQGRLRNTWLATLMVEPIPLWTLLQAAGLSGARSLTDLARFLEPVDNDDRTRGVA